MSLSLVFLFVIFFSHICFIFIILLGYYIYVFDDFCMSFGDLSFMESCAHDVWMLLCVLVSRVVLFLCLISFTVVNTNYLFFSFCFFVVS